MDRRLLAGCAVAFVLGIAVGAVQDAVRAPSSGTPLMQTMVSPAVMPQIAEPPAKSFGETCAADGDCASHACSKGKSESFCSMRCRRDADCPAPPSAGACNARGYCKKHEPKQQKLSSR